MPKVKMIKKSRRKKPQASPKAKGLIKERLVAQYLRERGWNIICQNKKVLGVETDLLAKKGQSFCLIEVKSLKKEEHLEAIVKDRQKERLKQVAESLSDDFPSLRLFLAAVSDKNKIEFFEIC